MFTVTDFVAKLPDKYAATINKREGVHTCMDVCNGLPLSHVAYMLATAWHETNATMVPVREAYWLSETWRKSYLKYWPWYGRGYVQLTWEDNYRKADNALHLQGTLMDSPDRALEPDIAAKVMRLGMTEGWFTGVKLSDVLPSKGVATRAQYMTARTIINGKDKADLIEDYAQDFELALRKANYGA